MCSFSFFLGGTFMLLFFFLGSDLYVTTNYSVKRHFQPFSAMSKELYCIPNRVPFQNFTRVNSEVLNPHFANISKTFYLNWGDHFSIWFKRIFWRLGILFTARSNKVSLDSSPQKSFMIYHSKYFFFHIQSFTIQAWLFQS